jgi:hypothetical protein
MPRPILIASRDAHLRQSRSQLLRGAGYTTIRIDDIGLACSMARFEAIGTVLVDSTFTAEEQNSLIYSLQQMMSRIHVICIWRDFTDTEALLLQCERCERQHEVGNVHILQGSAPGRKQREGRREEEPELTRETPPLSA